MADDIEIIDLTSEPNQTITIVSSSDEESESESPYKPQSQPQYELTPQYDPDFEPQFQSQPLPVTPKVVRTPKAKTPRGKKSKDNGIDKRHLQLLKEANRANAAAKALENCRTIIDKNVLKFIGDPDGLVVKTLFDESMIKYSIFEDQKIPNSITWSYKRTEVSEIGCIHKFKAAPWMIIIMEGKEYLERILTYRDNPEDLKSIKNYLSRMRDDLGCDIIFMVYNLASYLKNERAKDAKQYRKTFKDRFEGVSNDAGSLAQDEDRSKILALGVSELQELRLMLEVEFKHDNPVWKFHIEFYEKTNDIINSLVRYSLSMAKLEVKRNIKSSTGLDWAINMDKEKACDPTKSTDDLTKLWITQLQQFSQVTLPIAKCIAAEYPSPCSLMDQYRSLTSSEAENLLGELYVQRNLKRQVGPSISRRIHCFFTSEDPDVHIGLG